MARYSKINSFNALQTLTVGEKSYQIFNLPQAAQTLGNIDQLPKSPNASTSSMYNKKKYLS